MSGLQWGLRSRSSSTRRLCSLRKSVCRAICPRCSLALESPGEHTLKTAWPLKPGRNTRPPSVTYQLGSRKWCFPHAWICLHPPRRWSFEGRRGPGAPADGAGRACRAAPGLSDGGLRPLIPEGRSGF